MERTVSFTSSARALGGGSDYTIALQHPIPHVGGIGVRSAYVGHGEPAIPKGTTLRLMEAMHYRAGSVSFTFDVPNEGAPPVNDVGKGLLEGWRADVTPTTVEVQLPGTIAGMSAGDGAVRAVTAQPHGMAAWPAAGAQPIICNCSLNDCVLMLKDQTAAGPTAFDVTHKRTSMTTPTPVALTAEEQATVADDLAAGKLALAYPSLLASEIPYVVQGFLAAAAVPITISFDVRTGHISLSSHQHVNVNAGEGEHLWNRMALPWGNGWLSASHHAVDVPYREVPIPRGTFATPEIFANAINVSTRLQDIAFTVHVAGRSLAVAVTGTATPVTLAHALTAQTAPYVTWALERNALVATSTSTFTLEGTPAAMGMRDGSYRGEVRGEPLRVLRGARVTADGPRVALASVHGHTAVVDGLTDRANAFVTGDTLLVRLETDGVEHWRFILAQFSDDGADTVGNGVARDLASSAAAVTRGLGEHTPDGVTFAEHSRAGAPLQIAILAGDHVLGFTHTYASGAYVRAVTPMQTLPEPSVLLRIFVGQELVGRRVHVVSHTEETMISCRVLSTGSTVGYILDAPCAYRWEGSVTVKQIRVELLRPDGTPADADTVSSLTLVLFPATPDDDDAVC